MVVLELPVGSHGVPWGSCLRSGRGFGPDVLQFIRRKKIQRFKTIEIQPLLFILRVVFEAFHPQGLCKMGRKFESVELVGGFEKKKKKKKPVL